MSRIGAEGWICADVRWSAQRHSAWPLPISQPSRRPGPRPAERMRRQRPPGRRMLSAFGPIKQIDAGVLSVGYAEAGPADGRPVILLHGWPYDIHTLRRRRAHAGIGGLSRDRAVLARLRHHALPVGRHDAQRPAVGASPSTSSP